MAEYLLDANHLSTIVTEDHALRRKIHKQLRFGNTFSVAVPALTEMLYGIQMIERAQRNLREWNALHVMFGFYDIERVDAERAASLQVVMRHRGWQVSTVDALIAAVALRYDLLLLSTDNDFSAIPDLQRENWLA